MLGLCSKLTKRIAIHFIWTDLDASLIHFSLASHKWDIVKQRRPDEKPHNVASHQGLHCLFKRKIVLC